MGMAYENLSRKLFWRSNTVPFCGILLAILTLFFVIPPGGQCVLLTGDGLPEAENYSYELRESDPCPILLIKKDGRVAFDCSYVNDLDKLPKLIEYKLEEEQMPYYKRIHLEIHKDVKFGRVQEVLRIIKKEGYDIAGLLVDRPRAEDPNHNLSEPTQ